MMIFPRGKGKAAIANGGFYALSAFFDGIVR
jgi:hypothetical protein